MRGIVRALQTVLVMAFYAWCIISTPAWVYFEYRTAEDNHWGLFAVGLVVPPISAVEGPAGAGDSDHLRIALRGRDAVRLA